MDMDPFTALSLTGTLIQFVDFSSKLFSGAKSLYKSTNGALAVNDELELIVSDSNSVLSKLQAYARSPHHSAGESDAVTQDAQDDFKIVCDEAVRVAAELIERLQSFKLDGKVEGRRRIWGSLSQAIKSAWSHEEIVALQQRLKDLKNALETRVLLSFRETFDLFSTQLSQRLDTLDAQTRIIISVLVENQRITTNQIVSESLEQTATLAHLLSRTDINNTKEHRKAHEPRAEIDPEEILSGAKVVSFGQHEESQLRIEVNNNILEILRFESMSHRLEEVAEAHESTFNWRFGTEVDPEARSSVFSDWIGHEDSIYWLKGKAGSGKSTLMKSIFEDPRLREHLLIWASSTPCYLASFFFWGSATTRLQKSEQGLLRSLLFQILNQQTDLIPIVFPSLWARTYSHLLLGESKIVNQYWSLRVLKNAFRILVTQKIIPAKICLLIDGFDELEGDKEELATLADFLKSLANPAVKICISSRPWLVFEECFRHCEGLRLQDHTRPDIENYVHSCLFSNYGFRALSMRDSTSAEAFVQAIVERADGVFLWVVLAVRSLVNGIRNRDAMSDLQNRLNRLPRELEPLYDHLLSLIEPEYFEWSSKAFQIMRANQTYHESFEEKAVNGVSKTRDRLTTIEPFGDRYTLAKSFSILDLNLALDTDDDALVQEWTTQIILDRCEDTEVHLTARCAGLLEVWHLGNPSPKSEIHYLHRTVQEYIMRPRVWRVLKARTSHNTFNTDVSLMKICILRIGINPRQIQRGQSWYLQLAFHALFHARYAESSYYKAPPVLLDRLDSLMSTCTSTATTGNVTTHWSKAWTDYFGLTPASSFLPIAVMFGLISCLQASRHLRNLRASQADPPTSLLHYTIPRKSYKARNLSIFDSHMVEFLLKSMENPNLPYPEISPYQQALNYANYLYHDMEDQLLSFRILAMMLNYGADPQASGEFGQHIYASTILDDYFFGAKFDAEDALPTEVVALLDAVDKAFESNRGRLETLFLEEQKKPKSKRLLVKKWIKRIKT